MSSIDVDLQTERGDHQIVADALASVRLFHALYGNGEQAREWIRELSLTLYRIGANGRIGEHESILSTTADAIARSYLGCSAQELEWPNSVS